MLSKSKIDSDDQSKGSPRLAHLLASARDAFMKRGYQHVSVDSLARSAGVSKETIYRHFPDKAALFRAAMKGASEAFGIRLADLFNETDSAETILARCARAIYERGADVDNPSPNWLAVGTANSFPELAKEVFFDSIEGISILRDYLERIASSKGLDFAVSLDVMAQFGALAVEGPGHLMGWPPLTEAGRETSAARVARLFLHGYANGQDPARLRRPVPAQHQADQRQFETILPAPQPIVEAHIEHLMSVARSQFYERGYRGANLDEISAVARAGRGTLYRHFRNKAGLFEATMVQAAHRIIPRAAITLATTRSVEDNLLDAAINISAILSGRESIQLYRTVVAEARSLPHVGRQVYAQTRDPLARPLSDYLAWCASQDLLRIEDADWAAMQFMALAMGGNRYLALDPASSQTDKRRVAELAVSTFLHGYLGAFAP